MNTRPASVCLVDFFCLTHISANCRLQISGHGCEEAAGTVSLDFPLVLALSRYHNAEFIPVVDKMSSNYFIICHVSPISPEVVLEVDQSRVLLSRPPDARLARRPLVPVRKCVIVCVNRCVTIKHLDWDELFPAQCVI